MSLPRGSHGVQRPAGQSGPVQMGVSGDIVIPARVEGEMGETRRNIEGLLSVGVDKLEAFSAFLPAIGPVHLTRLAVEMIPDGLELVGLLYELSKSLSIEQKGLMGKACYEAGVHPVGIALCSTEGQEASTMLKDFKCDTWLADGMESGAVGGKTFITIKAHSLGNLEGLRLIVPGHLVVSGSPEYAAGALTVSSLEVVGGTLDCGDCCRFCFPNIREVGGSLNLVRAEKVTFSELTKIGQNLHGGSSHWLAFPKLETVGGAFEVGHSVAFRAANVKSVGANFAGYGTRGLTFNLLGEVRGDFRLDGAHDYSFTNLKRVDGRFKISVCAGSFPSLKQVGDLYLLGDGADKKGAETLSFPVLGRVGGTICGAMVGSDIRPGLNLPMLFHRGSGPFKGAEE